MIYSLPRNVFNLLEEALESRDKAEVLAKAIEEAIKSIDEKAKESITNKKNEVEINVRTKLREELASKEDIHILDEKIKNLNFKLNILIAIAIFGLTLANPTFTELIKMIFK